MSREVLRMATMVANQRLNCIKRVKELNNQLGLLPSMKPEEVDKSLRELGLQILNLDNLQSEYQSMKLQAENSGDLPANTH